MKIATLPYLPQFILENPDIAELLESEQIELDYLSECIELLRVQTTISTASIYLDRYEKIMAMDINPSLSDKERIGRVLAKLNSRVTATKDNIIHEIKRMTGHQVTVTEYYDQYCFIVYLIQNDLSDAFVQAVRNYLDEIKPAHLAYDLSLTRNEEAQIHIGGNYIISGIMKWEVV